MRLDRAGRIVLAVQALLLGALAVAGLLAAANSPTGVGVVAGFELNIPHSVLLLVTAGTSALAAGWARVARALAVIQTIGYTLIFLIGTSISAGSARDTWLQLNTADHFLHLGLAILGGLLGTVLLVQPAVIPGASEIATEHSSPTPREEESDETRDMIAAEIAVAEGHPTAEQERRVEEDAQRRATARRRRAWQQFRR